MSPPASMSSTDGTGDSRLPEKSAAPACSALLAELRATLAHEINQPLAAILGNAQAARRLILGSGISRGEMLAILDDIIRDTKRACEVTRNLPANLPAGSPNDSA